MIRSPKPHRRCVKDYIKFVDYIRRMPAPTNQRIVEAIDKAEASMPTNEYGDAIQMVITYYIRSNRLTMPTIADRCFISERKLSRIMADFYDSIARDAGLIE